MSALADKLIQTAIAEWNYFGNSVRSIDNHWHVVGEEADQPYRKHIKQYWAAVGFPNWDGATPQPWSGAFISWCCKTAGIAGDFDATHSVYIDRIRRQKNMPAQLVLTSPKTAVIAPGDLLWNTRDKAHPTPDYETAIKRLKAGTFFLSHVDIVVAVEGDTCSSIGGNVSDKDPGGSVTRSTWRLVNGHIADPRKTWVGVVKNGL